VSERETQTGDGEVGTCHICGQTFSFQEELSKHLIESMEMRAWRQRRRTIREERIPDSKATLTSGA
jgi:hypothetical protein